MPEPPDDNLLTFLEMAGQGCVSGRIADWPQLKPACKWAAAEIQRLRSVLQNIVDCDDFALEIYTNDKDRADCHADKARHALKESPQ